jgi:hypothetical protein
MKKDICILWPAAKDKRGYGVVKINGKRYQAHRVALSKKLGRKLVAGELALHTCDNKACVNPSHLIVGSSKDNRRHSLERGPSLAKDILGVDIGSIDYL